MEHELLGEDAQKNKCFFCIQLWGGGGKAPESKNSALVVRPIKNIFLCVYINSVAISTTEENFRRWFFVMALRGAVQKKYIPNWLLHALTVMCIKEYVFETDDFAKKNYLVVMEKYFSIF